MAKAGRKRKAGRRTRSGQLSRAGVPRFDHGTERAQAMQALYGTDGADAIGRAYKAGLLGEGQDAKALLDLSRRLSNCYWQAYSTGSYKCALADSSAGSVAALDHERIKRREEWLRDCLLIVSGMGSSVRRAFDQLCIDVHPDCGPAWLDAMIWARRRGIDADVAAERMMRAALDALRRLGG